MVKRIHENDVPPQYLIHEQADGERFIISQPDGEKILVTKKPGMAKVSIVALLCAAALASGLALWLAHSR
jgi:hypothetical protein